MINKCPVCGAYTLKEFCPKDKTKTVDVHYKFLRIRDAEGKLKR